jgi:hypothetical protein
VVRLRGSCAEIGIDRVERGRRSGRGKTRDVKLALGAQDKFG